MLSVVKFNYRALQKYFISPIKNIPVFLLRADESYEKASDLGWQKYAKKLHIFNMPGNHWGIVDHQLSKNYAHIIEKSLDMAGEEQILIGSHK